MNLEYVEKAKLGNKEAFEIIIMEVIDDLYKVAYCILRNEEDASDAISNKTLKAYEKIKTLKYVEFFKTWITKILINECNSLLKQRKKIVYIDNYTERAEDTYININSEMSIDIRNAMEILDDELQQLVILYYFDDLCIEEIAEIQKVPIGTIKSRLARARKILAKELINGYQKESI